MFAVILIFVVLPIVIVALVLNQRRYEIDKRTDVMLKAIECGVPTDSDFFRQLRVPALKKCKRKVQSALISFIIFFVLGLPTFALGNRACNHIAHYSSSELTATIEQWEHFDQFDELGLDVTDVVTILKGIAALLFIIGTLFLTIGVVILVIYFVRKNHYQDELAEYETGEYVK